MKEVFVWGVDTSTGEPWFLPDNTADANRAHVKSNVRCPVPGCGAELTAVSLSRGRDHLRHVASIAGDHHPESLAHAQGCAAVQSWLQRCHPAMTIRREEYTSPLGERRADVLLTAPDGQRVAFEVQYSPISAEHWRERHDSYQAQGIVDVWLFGSTTIKIDDLGWYKPQPMHEANLITGAPLLTIDTTDPTDARIEIIGQLESLPDGDDEIVVISHTSHRTRVMNDSLEVFSADPLHGITHDAIERLRASTRTLRQAEAVAAKREADQQEHFDRLKGRRQAQHESIANLLDSEQTDWPSSRTHSEMRAYFDRHLRGRIDTSGNVLCQWQCLLYFRLIAGHQGEEFTVRDAYQQLVRHKIPIDHKTAFKQIATWLRRLYDLDLIDRGRGKDGYPTYWAITRGAFW